MAERVGFEPTVPGRAQRFSRPPDSTTLAPLRRGRTTILAGPAPRSLVGAGDAGDLLGLEDEALAASLDASGDLQPAQPVVQPARVERPAVPARLAPGYPQHEASVAYHPAVGGRPLAEVLGE